MLRGRVPTDITFGLLNPVALWSATRRRLFGEA